MEKPINDYARALFILIEKRKGKFSMADVLKEYPFFYKFQARLSDLKKRLPEMKVRTELVPFANLKLNKTGYFFTYQVLNDKADLMKWYKKINVKK